MKKLLRIQAVLLMMAIVPLSGCLFRSKKVERRVSTAALREATKEQLVEAINAAAGKVQSLDATVDIDTDVGGERKGKVTQYQQIRGYVLVRKPGMLRMIGLLPLVRNRAFDMVSDGQEFKLWIPPKNRFIVGRNDVVHPSNQPLENLRPQVIMDALLLRPIDPQNEIAVLESGTETVFDPKIKKQVQQADYVLDVIRRGEQGWYLSRKIQFSRVDLLPHRQLIYDKAGNLATDAKYEIFKAVEGTLFPTQISVVRPQEEYSIVLSFLKVELNKQLRDDQFALQQPANAQVVRLDQPPGQRSAMRSGDGNKEPQ
jgi:outer membrane lipoprotein-sorting protein